MDRIPTSRLVCGLMILSAALPSLAAAGLDDADRHPAIEIRIPGVDKPEHARAALMTWLGEEAVDQLAIQWDSGRNADGSMVFRVLPNQHRRMEELEEERGLRQIEEQVADHRRSIDELREQMLSTREDMMGVEAIDPSDESRDHLLRQLQARLGRFEVSVERHHMALQRLEEERMRFAERRDIDDMVHRLEYTEQWQEVAFNRQLAVIVAAQSIVELGLESGDVEHALEVLRDLLEQTEDVGVRTTLRFAIRELAQSVDRFDEVVEQLGRIIYENARGERWEPHEGR